MSDESVWGTTDALNRTVNRQALLIEALENRIEEIERQLDRIARCTGNLRLVREEVHADGRCVETVGRR